ERAARFLGACRGEGQPGAESRPNAREAEVIQQEYDLQIADMLLSDSEVAQEYAAATPVGEASQDAGATLQAAKAQFTERFAQLQPGQDPGPVVQQFFPAALLAVRPLVSTALRL